MLDTYVKRSLDRGFTVAYSDSDIVSETYQNVLMGIRDSMTASYFTIGDVANLIILGVLDQGYNVNNQRVFDAVGRYCGKSGRTVRYYAETSSFYTHNVREEFEIVPFSHFVFARSMSGRWRDVLEFSASNPGMTAESLQSVFLDKRNIRELSQHYNQPEPQTEHTEPETMLGNFTPGGLEEKSPVSDKPPEVSQDTQNQTRIYYSNVLSALSDSLNKATRIVLELDESSLRDKDDIIRCMDYVKSALPDVSSAITRKVFRE